jgi:hypothetical protein
MKYFTPFVTLLMALALAANVLAQDPYLAAGVNRPAPPRESTGLVPLTELGTAKYKGEDGGLYGGGKNEPPAVHAAAARKQGVEIMPRDADGKPAKDGKIGVLSVGMSNTTMEYSAFKRLAEGDPEISPKVVLVDGAQGGKTAMVWARPDAPVWQEVEARLQRAGVTPQQVQVVWIKQAEAGPSRLGEFPAHAQVLETHLVSILNLLHQKFPNLRIAYLSSRIYAGLATTPLNPEPYAYESAFAVRWVIRDQINGKPELNCDPARGEVKSPLVLWGPYLWADGTRPRKGDGLVWHKQDLSPRDGTHPAMPEGARKVAKLLLTFLKADPFAKRWFTVDAPDAPARK